MNVDELKGLIRDVPDFPVRGIMFRDITTLLKDPVAYKAAIDMLAEQLRKYDAQKVVAIESRGFILGAPLAYLLNAGFIPARKLGKLPAPTVSAEYALEYSTNTVEMHRDAIKPGERVIIVDAENPMEEIHGEFFWREDHEVLLAAARDEGFRSGRAEGYREGYGVGWADCARQQTPQRFVATRRRSLLGWVRLVILLMLAATFVPLLVGMLLDQLLAALR